MTLALSTIPSVSILGAVMCRDGASSRVGHLRRTQLGGASSNPNPRFRSAKRLLTSRTSPPATQIATQAQQGDASGHSGAARPAFQDAREEAAGQTPEGTPPDGRASSSQPSQTDDPLCRTTLRATGPAAALRPEAATSQLVRRKSATAPGRVAAIGRARGRSSRPRRRPV
jgi:hypothetical protein